MLDNNIWLWPPKKFVVSGKYVLLIFLFTFAGSDNKELDKSNEGLYKEILEKIARVNDREVELLDKDHEDFLKFLNKSQNGRVLKFPQRDPLLPSRRRSSANRRGSSARQGESSLKWSCFIKGVSSSRCLITMVPKNYWWVFEVLRRAYLGELKNYGLRQIWSAAGYLIDG